MRRPVLATAVAVSALSVALVGLPTVASADAPATSTAAAATTTPVQGTPTSRAEWVTQDDLTTVTTGAFPDGWFTTGPTTSGVDGLALPTGTLVAHARTGSAATDLTDVYSTDAAGRLGLGLPTADLFAGSGGTRYALLLDLAGSADNTTPAVLSAAEAGAQGVDGTWRSSVDIGTVRAGSAATLATFQEQIAATTPDATVNGYGAFARTAPGTVVGILGNETRSYFTPEPTAVVGVPSNLTPSVLRADGLPVEGTGFLPGEEVSVFLILPDAEIVPDSNRFTVDADGAFAGQTTFVSSAPPSEYQMVFEGLDSGIVVFAELTIQEEPTAGVTPPTPTPAVLPGTGTAPVATPVPGNVSFTG
ncbi:hypothetical protein DEJ16_03930 [Curtobacterium sp. MCJR17_055]|uniref:hypothetical protein n=1 Tax=unclassified Curtobacterium TaxID=257496 RepID=UPI000DA07471|nr:MULTISPECIES: hypothetical protein [unclassified Curtobacterium]PYY32553.1 hypothetical protein DEI87_14365 [Curtobacterium sp. MCBD17_029]PYY58813.1 hypothetical protein DEJ16_03930 [Curtobacterium sp. MCJR17_055]PYY59646.1 hypothetical protein DEJ26_06975 [Curtobacterium sp. MCPF17_015]